MKKGDKVIITTGSKIGLIGKIHLMLINGAIVELNDDHFMPVKFEHLKLVKRINRERRKKE